MLEPIVVDRYTPLSHKALMGERAATQVTASWVPAEDRRRLAAYIIRAAYIANGARQLLPDNTTPAKRRAHREYGDAALLVDRVVAGVLGDWTIAVDGAGDDLTDGPNIGPEPLAPDDTGDTIANRIYQIKHDAWQRNADAAIDEWEQALDAQPAARQRETELRDWADRIGLTSTVNEIETMAAGLGDAAVIAWPREGDWPLLQTLDPGFYFPLLPEDGGLSRFPDRVDFAWEFDRTLRDRTTERMVRRITFELVPITSTRLGSDDQGAPTWLGADGAPADAPYIDATLNEQIDTDGTIWRTMPWADDGDITDVTCVVSDGVFPIADTRDGLYHFDLSHAEWEAYRVDLRCDFIPVVHVPGTAAGQEHFGSSVIDQGAQILDDVSTNDTDSMKASRYLSDPTIAMSGTKAPEGGVVMPGRMYGLGDNGRMDVLDLSAGLERLMAHGDRLQDRYWQTSRVPSEMIGRAESTGAIAGVTLALRFAPFAQVVGQIRTIRAAKYELLFRMTQRLAQLAGVIDAGPTPRARILFGNFLPTNQAETVNLVAAALNAHAISTQTAVAMLVAAGLPVEDAAAEVERITDANPDRYAAAKDLADATGSEAAAAEWLGIDVPEQLGAPVLDFGA